MRNLFVFLMLFSTPALAATAADAPVEISAKKSLEWDRKAKTYTAREDVVVTQGDVKIESETLTARYRDDSGATDITTLEAATSVVITSHPYTAFGDKAVYDVKTGRAVMTGKDLKVITDDNVLTADEKIEFVGAENKLNAVGNATVTRGTDTLTAPALVAHFIKSADGRMMADTIKGNGGVTIRTDKETVTGDSAVYNVQTKKAVLSGKVRILQGKNWLEGTRADVDMATGISKLSGGTAATGGRVKGVFYPKSEKN